MPTALDHRGAEEHQLAHPALAATDRHDPMVQRDALDDGAAVAYLDGQDEVEGDGTAFREAAELLVTVS